VSSERPQLEPLLAQAEANAGAALTAVRRLQTALRALERAARDGDLKGMRRAREAVREARAPLDGQVGSAERWPFAQEDEEAWLADGSYAAELRSHAEAAGLPIQALDNTLVTYPSRLKIEPRSLAVSLNGKLLKAIRPSLVVRRLADARSSEPKLNTRQFIEMLRRAYRVLAPEGGRMIRLVDIHRLLTIRPGSAREYDAQEFARDLYLLDRSGETASRDGARLRLSAGATGARNRRNLLVTVGRDGEERTYYGVEFTEPGT